MNSHALGIYLRQRRKELGITQQDMSELSGISMNTINKIELGKANPTLRILLIMSDVLGLDVSLSPKVMNPHREEGL